MDPAQAQLPGAPGQRQRESPPSSQTQEREKKKTGGKTNKQGPHRPSAQPATTAAATETMGAFRFSRENRAPPRGALSPRSSHEPGAQTRGVLGRAGPQRVCPHLSRGSRDGMSTSHRWKDRHPGGRSHGTQEPGGWGVMEKEESRAAAGLPEPEGPRAPRGRDGFQEIKLASHIPRVCERTFAQPCR